MSDTGKAKKGFGEWIITVYTGIGAVAMGLLAVMVIFTVICRYCFSLSWKQVSEFNVTLFAFTTFWGLGLNVLKNEHVSINILYDALPPVPKRVVHCLDLLIMLVVDCVFTKYAWDYTLKMGTQISQGMEIPMRYMYGLMPVCGALAAVCIVAKLIEGICAPRSAYEKKEGTAQ
jgi:TRAP-type C4-dicarboxylate transport system permease small subunit